MALCSNGTRFAKAATGAEWQRDSHRFVLLGVDLSSMRLVEPYLVVDNCGSETERRPRSIAGGEGCERGQGARGRHSGGVSAREIWCHSPVKWLRRCCFAIGRSARCSQRRMASWPASPLLVPII